MAPPSRSSAGGFFLIDMFAAIQFPFTDARQFIASETNRLAVPSWPLAKAEKDFIRSFGPVKRRRKGGLDDWPGEEIFCRAIRAVRFPSSPVRFADFPSAGLSLRQSCAFRRFLVDGAAVARMEMGFR